MKCVIIHRVKFRVLLTAAVSNRCGENTVSVLISKIKHNSVHGKGSRNKKLQKKIMTEVNIHCDNINSHNNIFVLSVFVNITQISYLLSYTCCI